MRWQATRYIPANLAGHLSSGRIRGRNTVPKPAVFGIANGAQGQLQALWMRRKNVAKKRGNSEGSIYRMTDGRWRAAVTVGRDANGKPKRKVFTSSTRREVKDQLNDALKDLKLGRLVAPEKQTVGQFLTWWLEAVVKPSARPKTMKAYEYQSRIHLIPGLGHIPLQKLTSQHVQAFLNDRLTRPSKRTERPLSRRTVRSPPHAVYRPELRRQVWKCRAERCGVGRPTACTETKHQVPDRRASPHATGDS
jgi:hypothetical protein